MPILHNILQENMTFQKVQLDLNIHIEQGGWSFWLKAQSMREMIYFWLRHLITITFLTMWQTKHLIKKAKGSSRWPRLQKTWPYFMAHYDLQLIKLAIIIWHLAKSTILIWLFKLTTLFCIRYIPNLNS